MLLVMVTMAMSKHESWKHVKANEEGKEESTHLAMGLFKMRCLQKEKPMLVLCFR